MIEVRVRVQVAGEVLLSGWRQGATDAEVFGELSRDVEVGAVLSTSFVGDFGGARFVSGRHVEWFEVETRTRR